MQDTRHNIWLNIRIDNATKQRLNTLSKRSGHPMSAIVRMLINGHTIRETPPLDYHKMIAELHAIGNNMNQIAHVANAIGHLDSIAYKQHVAQLHETILHIKRAVELRE